MISIQCGKWGLVSVRLGRASRPGASHKLLAKGDSLDVAFTIVMLPRGGLLLI